MILRLTAKLWGSRDPHARIPSPWLTATDPASDLQIELEEVASDWAFAT